jgi:hypothetical protein
MSMNTDPLGLRGRQVSVSRCSDDLNLSLNRFLLGMTEATLEFDIIMKGVDLLKLNHNVHALYIVRYLLLYIICKG